MSDEGFITYNQDDPLHAAVVRAAQDGDRLAFAAAADRLGSLEQAQQFVRCNGILRMADRNTVIRSVEVVPQAEFRAADTETGDGNTMFGHFATFNDWTEIDSWFEGRFLERIAPGAFKKTFRENRSDIRSLFQHGFDPQIGDKPLGQITDLREDESGGYYEVSLLDAGYVRDDILPGLQAGLYGASFRFKMMREDFNTEPERSDANPDGLPERTLKEVRVYEFGPVTFPAYPSATAGVRSGDADPGDENPAEPAPVEDDAAASHHPTRTGRVGASPRRANTRRGSTSTLTLRKEKPQWLL